jgi:glycosyltransferase involved in cell wall biosynthesis
VGRSIPKLAIVSASAVPGGAERALLGLVRQLPTAGIEPFAVLLQPGPLAEWLALADCPTVVLDAGRTRQLYRTASVLARIRKSLIEQRADVVLSSQSKSHVYGGVAALSAGLPAVWWQMEIPHRSRIEWVAGRVPAAVVICASRAAEEAQRRLTPHRQILRIPLSVDVPAIAARRGSGRAVRRQLGWEGNRVVGIVGRLQPDKGQMTFLEAAALLAQEHDGIRFAIVGGAILGWEGSYPSELRQRAKELGLADRVHFAGHQDDVAPWFDACDVVVHAALNEPFGLVLIEAMALGKPLVAASAGGPIDIVEDGLSGVLTPPGNPSELARAVGRVLEDPALAAMLATGAAKRAESFTDQRVAAQLCEALNAVATLEPTERRLALSHLAGP